MQKAFIYITALILAGGVVFAQDEDTVVENILSELMNYEPAAEKSPAAEDQGMPDKDVATEESRPAPVVAPVADADSAPVADTAADADSAGEDDLFTDLFGDTSAVDSEPVADTAADAEAVDPFANLFGETATQDDSVAEPEAAATDAEILAEPFDIDALVEQSRVDFSEGNFVQAQQGFEKVLRAAPENWLARMYLRSLLERGHRKAEVSGMKAVDAAWSTDMVVRSYVLGQDAEEKMGLINVKDAMNVEALFPKVDFPKGASAIFQPDPATLYVRNTRDNLARLETVLEATDMIRLSGNVEQVEIESKFVEVSEGTLEELGFEWRSKTGSDVGLSGDVNVPGGQYLFDDALRGGPSGPAMPFVQPGSILPSGQIAADSAGWSSSRMEDTFSPSADFMTVQYRGARNLDLLISALDQSSGADVLSAPRVVTRNGEEATIRVGELHYYPEVFEGDNSQTTILNVSYEDFEEKVLGVELIVTPEIDGDQITLSLNPKITELAGWQNYQLAEANSLYSYYRQTESSYTHDAIIAKLPIFKKREINTEVTIADGSTIGMGGLINEKIEAFEDKVPVLGSLPLVGRLFRNEGERAVKRNLLMFVTVKKIDPSGRVDTSRSFE